MSTGHLPHSAELPAPTLHEVSEGVYAYIQLDGSWGLNNTGFFAGKDGVTIIDTCFTETRTRAYLEAIRGITPAPFRALVNTHHHDDHTHGNYLVPGASIIGHRLCREMVIETGFETLRPRFPGVDLNLSPIFADMKAYNGGQPLRCLV